MTFTATVVRVLIASPGDTAESRRTLRQVLDYWNSGNAEDTNSIIFPIMWEMDAVPEMGETPQAILNRQIVDTADMLIGTFWTRLGTPTADAESGTVDEIERFVAENKPVLLYFSQEPVVPGSVEMDEYARLTEFRASLKQRGLFDTFHSQEALPQGEPRGHQEDARALPAARGGLPGPQTTGDRSRGEACGPRRARAGDDGIR